MTKRGGQDGLSQTENPLVRGWSICGGLAPQIEVRLSCQLSQENAWKNKWANEMVCHFLLPRV